MSSLPSPDQSNRPPFWFILLLILGVPISWLTVVKIIQQPWLAAVIVLSYFGIVIICGILAGVWQELKNQWVRKIVDWINGPHDYQKRYCRSLILEHNQFDVGGLDTYGTSLPTLEQIFVELNLAERPPYQITSTKFKAPEASFSSQHPVSYYMEQEKHLVLLGVPGSGKTTLLKNLGLKLVYRKKKRKAPKIQYELPFFLSLRDYGNTIKDQEQLSLADAIQTPLHKWNRSAPTGWVESRLDKGNCLILLDGLDEVPYADTRLEMAQWVQQQMITYGHNNLFILTSRPHGYKDNTINGVMVLEVQGFTYKQIEDFVHNWYYAEESNRLRHVFGPSENAKKGAEDFLLRLHSTPTLSDLARNPLLLTMSIMVHRYRGALPGSRGELYKEICNVFLGGRQRAKGLRLELSPEQNQLVLQPLAFHMMEQQKTELMPSEAESIIENPLRSVSAVITPQAFLKIIEDSNIWAKQGLDVYGFAHLSFQEYLAAMYVKERDLKQVLVDHVGSSWWRETIILYCNRADASQIIKACLTVKPLTVYALQLTLECEEAASRSSSISDPSVRALFDTVITQGAENADPEIRQMVKEAKLAQRIKNMLSLEEKIYVTTSLISCSEYQLFLDEQQQQGMRYQPDHWTHAHFPSGQGGSPVLGIRPSDALAFCAWLTKRDQGNWHYRLPHSSELQRLEKIATGNAGVAAGLGHWIDEGTGFHWSKKGSFQTKKEIPAQFDLSSTHDAEQVMRYQMNPSIPQDKYVVDCITYARNLSYARTLNEKLLQELTTIQSRIYDREIILKTKYESAQEYKTNLQAQLDYSNEQESNLRTQLDYAYEQENNLQAQLMNYTQEQESDLQDQLAYVQEQASDLQDQLVYVQEQISELQGQLVYVQEQASILQNQLVYAEEDESDLLIQLSYLQEQENDLIDQLATMQEQASNLQSQLIYNQEQASNLQSQLIYNQEQASNLQSQLANIQQQRQASNLLGQLVYAQEQEDDLKAQFDRFSSQAHTFYDIYQRFLVFNPIYDKNNAFSNALTRNDVLNIDRILVNINSNDAEKALIRGGGLISNYVRELAQSLVSYRNSADSVFNDFDTLKSFDAALDLVNKLSQISISVTVQNLVQILRYYLNNLAERRLFGRGRADNRLFIRYFSKELALHSSYWFWKELFSNSEQVSHLMENITRLAIDTYFDVYVVFAILEERIEGKRSANEGILIVREYQEENQE